MPGGAYIFGRRAAHAAPAPEGESYIDPTVSFVVACYNYGRYVNQAIDSLLGQTLREIEVIVIDDASTDRSDEAIATYAGDPRVHAVRHQRNRGHIETYNEGLSMARGRYVGLLSADDYVARPDAVARQVQVFDANPAVGLVHAAYQTVDAAGRAAGSSGHWHEDYVVHGLEEFRQLIWANYVPHSGTLVRRSCHDELGYYDTRLPIAGDWDLWLRIAARFDVAYIAEPLYAYRLHESNMMGSAPFSQTSAELALTLERAFASLPETAPRELRMLRRPALRHALLLDAHGQLTCGRRARAWQACAHALRRSPSVALSREFWSVVSRAALMSAIGHSWYDAARRTIRRGRRPAPAATP